MGDYLRWLIIGAMFLFGFVYAPLRSSWGTTVTPPRRRRMVFAAIGSAVVAVAVGCVMAFR